MRYRKKYLAAAGGFFIILPLFLLIYNYNYHSKKDTAITQDSKEIEESIQATEDNPDAKENNTILSAKESSSTEDTTAGQNVSEDDRKEDIDKLIRTYYEAFGNTDENALKEEKQPADGQKADGQTDKGQEDDNKQEESKENAGVQTERQTAESKEAAGEETESQAAKNKKTEAFEKVSEIIEAYKNIKTYIKPGLGQDSYVVFTTYDIKLYNIDTLVPGMSSLSVLRDENGSLYIDADSNDKKLNSYISKLTKEKDIQKIIQKVNTKLKIAKNKNNSLKEFIDYLK